MNTIKFNKPFIVGKELYYIAQAVTKNSQISGGGYFTKLCHEWFESKLGCTKALLTHSCTAALEMAAILCDIGPGDEVIMPSYTFVSTANAFVLRGAIPVFVDIRPDTLNIDESIIAQAVTDKTKAIVPVHYAGVPCEMDEILDIADRKNLFVIEDAAQALLSSYHNKYLGTLGHLGCLSFHETKNIICGEGGALLVNDKRLVERAEIIWEKGTNRSKFFRGEVDKYTWVDLGSSYLPSDIIAAFLFSQLEHASQIVEKRLSLFLRYFESFCDLAAEGYIKLPSQEEYSRGNGHLFYLVCRSIDERSQLIDFLKSRGIGSVFHYVPLHSSPAGTKYGRPHAELQVTDSYSSRLLRLPLFYEMTSDEQGAVIAAVKEFYSNK